MTRILLVSSMLLLGGIEMLAQQGELRGRVTDEQGEPLAGVNVHIEGTAMGTTTDSKGFYRLSKLGTGNKKVLFTYMGYKAVVHAIDMQLSSGRPGDKHEHLNIIMQEAEQALQSRATASKHKRYLCKHEILRDYPRPTRIRTL